MLAAIFLIAVTFVATNAFTPSTTSKNFELFSLNYAVYVDITHVTRTLYIIRSVFASQPNHS